MMLKNDSFCPRRTKATDFFGALLLGLFLLLFTYCFSGIYFETNDDNYISLILNGTLTGKPEYHTLYNSVLLSFPLMILYRITAEISWYGIVVFLIHLFSLALPLAAAFSGMKSRGSKIVASIVAVVLYGMSYYLHGNLQYTSTAMGAAIAGFVCLILARRFLEGTVFFLVLESLAYGLRPESMEIMQPIGFAISAAYMLCTAWKGEQSKQKELWREAIRRILMPLSFSLIIIILGSLTYKFAYRGVEWQNALSVNEARTVLFDYYGMPAAEEISDILEKHQISQTELNAYNAYMNYQWDDSNGALEEIAARVLKNVDNSINPQELIKWSLFQSYTQWTWRLKWMLLVCVTLEVGLIFYSRSFRWFFIKLFYYVAKCITWGFVYYKGRMPERIMVPLYFTEILVTVLVAYMVCKEMYKSHVKNERSKKYIILAVIGVFCLAGCFPAYTQGKMLRNEKNVKIALNQLERETEAYCAAHPEQNYLLSPVCSSAWKMSVFDRWGPQQGFAIGGGWFGVIPDYKEQVKLLMSKEAVSVIIPQADIATERTTRAQLDFLAEKYGGETVLSDTIQVSTGGYYEIYQLK